LRFRQKFGNVPVRDGERQNQVLVVVEHDGARAHVRRRRELGLVRGSTLAAARRHERAPGKENSAGNSASEATPSLAMPSCRLFETVVIDSPRSYAISLSERPRARADITCRSRSESPL